MKRFHMVCASAFSAILLSYGVGAAQTLSLPKEPSDSAKTAARNLVKILPRHHLTGHAFDQEIARRWRLLFLKELDPFKIYFDQKDVEALRDREKQIQADFEAGEIQFVFDAYQTFLKRVDERLRMARELLKDKYDFSVEESIVRTHAKAAYAENDAQARDLWRKRIKHEMLEFKADGLSDDDARARLKQRFDAWANNYRKLDEDGLLDIAFTALARAYDAKSSYISPRAWEAQQEGIRNQFEGVGITIRSVDGECVVLRLVPGSPAHKDGRIKPGDRIVGVEKAGGKMQDIAGWRIGDIVKLIRGPRASKIRLEVIPAGQSERLLYTLARDRIDTETARATVLEVGKKADGRPFKIGYLFLPALYGEFGAGGKAERSSAADLRRLLENPTDGLITRGVDLVVLDLRTNNGGLLNQSLDVCDLFLDGGPVLQIKDKAGKVQQYSAPGKAALWKGSLAVLTSKTTASGAEIIVGALQSHGRALVIGETTIGLGTVQNFYDVESLSVLSKTVGKLGLVRVTTSQFYRPNGESTQKRGVLPDVELPWLANVDYSEANADYPTEFDRIDALRVERAAFGIDDALRKKLRAASALRREQSEDFRRLDQAIDIASKRKERGSIPLEEKRFLAERKVLGSDNQRFQKVEDTLPVLRDFYLEEALAIGVEFLGLIPRKE